MKKVVVAAGGKKYEVQIGSGLLAQAGAQIRGLGVTGKIAVVTNPIVGKLYGAAIKQNLEEAGFIVNVFEVRDGEQQKSLIEAGKLYNKLSRFQAERSTPIITLGGGVIGDLAGFVAATYMRGVSLIQVPTTLLAQVDSSIGGKVAVNHGQLKNMIGAFYQPRLVLSDIRILASLPEKEIENGLAEIIKYGVIRDSSLFNLVESNIARLKLLDEELTEDVVFRSVKIKAEIVAQDETDSGIRNILNFGHTVGHALEAVLRFQISHGKAVATGMVAAGMISHRMDIFKNNDLARLIGLIEKSGLPVKIQGVSAAKILQAMKHDKKVKDGRIRFVLPEKIGKVMVTDRVELSLINEVLRDLNAEA